MTYIAKPKWDVLARFGSSTSTFSCCLINSYILDACCLSHAYIRPLPFSYRH